MKLKLLSLMLFSIILLSSVSAYGLSLGIGEEFNQHKSSYGTVEVWEKHIFIPNKKLGEVTLYKNSDQTLINGYAEGEIILYENSTLFDEFDFIDKNGKRKYNEFNIFLEVEDREDVTFSNYSLDCEEGDSTGETCVRIDHGEYEKEIISYDWKKYKGEIKEGSEEGIVYKWRIEGKKEITERIDWSFGMLGLSSETFREYWAWWNTDWEKKLTINITGSEESLSYYPILINVTYDADMQANFNDIRFVDGACDGVQDTELPYEIDHKVNSDFAMVWVNIPTLATGTNQICMYYDNSLATNGENRQAVWSNYVMVFHMNDDSGTLTDSSYSEFNLTTGGSPVATSAGRIGGAFTFDGNDYFTSQGLGSAPAPATVAIEVFAKTTEASPAQNNWVTQYESNAGTAIGGILQLGGGVQMHFSQDYGTENTWYTNLPFLLNNYKFVTGNWEQSDQNSHMEKTAGATTTDSGTIAYEATPTFTIGAWQQTSPYAWKGDIDEVRVSNVTRGSAWINRTADITDFSLIAFGEEELIGTFSTVSNSPANSLVTNNPTINFNCTTYGTNNITNLTLIIDDLDNYTITNGVTNFSELYSTTTVSEGVHNWSCRGADSTDDTANSATRTLTLDTVLPVVNVTSPLNGSQTVTLTTPTNISFNSTITETNINNCWYFNTSENVSITCGNNATLYLGGGEHNLIYYANDSAGNYASDLTTFTINYINNTAYYPSPALEGETYSINLTINATYLTSLSGTLYYNGTAFTTTSSIDGSIGVLDSTLIIPNVTQDDFKTFFWNFTINGVNYTSIVYNHSVYYLDPLTVEETCTGGLEPAMCFNFQDEINLTSLNASIDYNFNFGITNTSYKNVYGSLTDIDDFCLCLNSTVSNNYGLGDSEIQYSKNGYADRRFYTFNTQRLSNSTINNTLFLLLSGSATSFLFDFQQTDLAPYVEKYTTLLRWFPSLDEYKVVEMAKTDDKGETIMRVEVEDVDYRVGLYEKSGTLIKLLNPVRFACLSAPCTYSTLVDTSTTDYTSFFKVQGGITFNETSNVWTLIWNDPTQDTDSMNLVVTRERGDSSFTICNTSASGFTGVLTCDSTGYTGTLRGIAYRTASPAKAIFNKVVNTITSPFASGLGLLMSFFLLALLMLMGTYSPVASVILGVVALIPALYFGVINLAIFIAIAVLGGIVIHFAKRTR